MVCCMTDVVARGVDFILAGLELRDGRPAFDLGCTCPALGACHDIRHADSSCTSAALPQVILFALDMGDATPPFPLRLATRAPPMDMSVMSSARSFVACDNSSFPPCDNAPSLR